VLRRGCRSRDGYGPSSNRGGELALTAAHGSSSVAFRAVADRSAGMEFYNILGLDVCFVEWAVEFLVAVVFWKPEGIRYSS
jgi:hypothetical protein